jgi:hypothetical protein
MFLASTLLKSKGAAFIEFRTASAISKDLSSMELNPWKEAVMEVDIIGLLSAKHVTFASRFPTSTSIPTDKPEATAAMLQRGWKLIRGT